MNIKTKERLKKGLKKFRPILQSALDRDVSEADTVHIIHDMLDEIMGWDKYSEVTTEYKIRNTFCDLAIKYDGKLKFLIEAKAIGHDLKENHLRQAIGYAANEGINWVILTNARVWQVHQVVLNKKIQNKEILAFDLLNTALVPQDLYDMLFTLCKEAVKKEGIESYAARQSVINRHIISALLLSKSMIDSLRREIRKINKDVKASPEEITEILVSSVIKRELLEGDRAKSAKSQITRAQNKRLKETEKKKRILATKKEADNSLQENEFSEEQNSITNSEEKKVW